MKSTGIVRRVDELGRIVIPIELRRNLDIKIADPLEIYTEGEQIILKKYGAHCCVCGNNELDDSTMVNGKVICKKCSDLIKKSR